MSGSRTGIGSSPPQRLRWVSIGPAPQDRNEGPNQAETASPN